MTSRRKPQGRRFKLPTLGGLPYLILVFGPIFLLFLSWLSAGPAQGPDWPALMLPQGRRLSLLARSVSLALATSASALWVAILAVPRLATLGRRRRMILGLALLAAAAIPPYVQALTWSALAGGLSRILIDVGASAFSFRGWGAAWWVQSMSSLPLAVLLSWLALEFVDREWIEAGRVQRRMVEVFTAIQLPLAAPHLLAAGGVIFVLNFVEYSVPSLMQVNTYPLEVFADFSAHAEPARALSLATPALILAGGAILASQARLRNIALASSWRQWSPMTEPAWPGWWIQLQRGAWIVLGVQMIVPFVVLLSLNRSASNFIAALSSAWPEIHYSLGVAAASAVLGLLLAWPVSRRLAHKGKASAIWWVLISLPLALPAPLIGIALLGFWSRFTAVGIYGSDGMPVLAAGIRFGPFMALALVAGWRRTNPALFEAAQVFPIPAWRRWLLIEAPIYAPTALAAGGLGFLLALGELGATLIVLPAGRSTLTLRIYSFLHYGASETVAALCLLIALLALFLGFAAAGLALVWSRWMRPAS